MIPKRWHTAESESRHRAEHIGALLYRRARSGECQRHSRRPPNTGRPLRKTGRQTGANNGNASAADAPSAPHHQNHKEDKDRNRHFHNGWIERYQNESPERRCDEGGNPKW